jgi:hypothetical protein
MDNTGGLKSEAITSDKEKIHWNHKISKPQPNHVLCVCAHVEVKKIKRTNSNTWDYTREPHKRKDDSNNNLQLAINKSNNNPKQITSHNSLYKRKE